MEKLPLQQAFWYQVLYRRRRLAFWIVSAVGAVLMAMTVAASGGGIWDGMMVTALVLASILFGLISATSLMLKELGDDPLDQATDQERQG